MKVSGRGAPHGTASDAQHDQGEIDAHRTGRAVLSTGPAVPAFGRVSHLDILAFHIEDIQRAVFVADSASVAFISINDRRHGALLQNLLVSFKSVYMGTAASGSSGLFSNGAIFPQPFLGAPMSLIGPSGQAQRIRAPAETLLWGYPVPLFMLWCR